MVLHMLFPTGWPSEGRPVQIAEDTIFSTKDTSMQRFASKYLFLVLKQVCDDGGVYIICLFG